MNVFKDKDPFGFKKLDKELNKAFKLDLGIKEPKLTKRGGGNEPFLTKKDIDNLKQTYRQSKKVCEFIVKLINKNKLPSDPEEILKLEKELEKQQVLKAEAERAMNHIKILQRQEREARKRERQEKIKRIRRLLRI